MRLFLDANVLFSAAYSPAGRARALFHLAERGRCKLSASTHVIDEALRNLRTKAPARLPKLDELLSIVEQVPAARPDLVAWAAAKGLPDNDAPVLATAVSSSAEILVTGDRTHFGHLFGRSVGGTVVASLSDALDTVLKEHGF